jgi:hypothetical protein
MLKRLMLLTGASTGAVVLAGIQTRASQEHVPLQGEQRRAGDPEVKRALLASGAILASLTACSGGTDFGPSRTEEGDSFASVIDKAANHVTTFQTVFGDDFDTAVVACPLVGPDDVKQDIGSNWSDASDLPLRDESKNSVVLVKHTRVVHVEILDTTKINLCAVGGIGVTAVTPIRRVEFTQQDNTDGSTGWVADLTAAE